MIIITPHLNLAYIKHKGPIQADGFIQLVMDLASHSLYVPGINVLYDYRHTDFSEIQQKDMKRFHEYLLIQRKNLYNRIAIVVNNDDDFVTSSLWQIHASTLPHNRKMFKSIVQGESWLFETAPTQIKDQYHQMNHHGEIVKNRCVRHVIDQEGTIVTSTVTNPIDGIALPGRNISDIFHKSYAYPFQCLLRRVIKTRKHSWINLRLFNHDYADYIVPMNSHSAHVSEFLISGMGDYEVERLKWLVIGDNMQIPACLQDDHPTHAILNT